LFYTGCLTKYELASAVLFAIFNFFITYSYFQKKEISFFLFFKKTLDIDVA